VTIRVAILEGTPAGVGLAHGSAYGGEIREYAAERVRLAGSGLWSGSAAARDTILELASACLPAHEEYAPDLYEEMVALADAAHLTPEEALVVGGFTDFVDVVRASGEEAPYEDTCTAVIVPDHAADGAGFLAQTWDMHATATPHIVMLDLRPEGSPAALVFTTVGCLGQIGMNDAGVAVGINNLTASNGTPGVTWPFVVRKALQAPSAEAALDSIMSAQLAGAHNYLVFDASGEGFDVEAMPGHCAVTALGQEVLAHTNHCLVDSARRIEEARPPELQASSEARLMRATELTKEWPITAESLMALTRDPEAVCQRPRPPYHVESCGAAVMRPATGDFWAVWGIPADNDYEHFTVHG
jgi:isopenicillin-N N-acyltransferase-like protein